jgi:hypothetical protein
VKDRRKDIERDSRKVRVNIEEEIRDGIERYIGTGQGDRERLREGLREG